MAYDTTKKIAQLPVYKDKVMYISQNQSKYKIEQSYVISASYNGILRLSPNNYNTITEYNTIELNNENEHSISSSYSDAIVFESSATPSDTLDNNGSMLTKKMDADITKRMIIGSDSDGYLVNFRFSDVGVEFDKLGVIGITQTNKLSIYTTNDIVDNIDSFILGNTIMPSVSNSACDITMNTPAENNKRIDAENYDEIEVKISDKGDNSYLLGGIVGKNGKRAFEFKRAQDYIREVIMEALLSIQSVPTGSIHWFPVTYEQYCSMINDVKQYPNEYNTEKSKPSDPLIRDYLLCDGRKYKTTEFPELAKILINEKITYWDDNYIDENGNEYWKMCEEKNAQPYKSTNADGETETKKPDYFRVPDMRTKFISYVNAKGTDNALTSEQYNTDRSIITAQWNTTGLYTPDNSPKKSNVLQQGNHFHFNAYGSYSHYNSKEVRYQNNFYRFVGYKFGQKLADPSTAPSIWYLWNTPIDASDIDSSGYYFGFQRAESFSNESRSKLGVTAYFFSSAPEGGYKSYIKEPSVGLSSKSKMIYIIPTENADTYKITQYETFDNYQDLETPIQEHPEGESEAIKSITSRYGSENAPKFYAFLPLIKI